MNGRVISIQSHVAHGYVGNRAAVFPLQLLKHEVDFINTVSYTSMYIHEGTRCGREVIRKLLETLPAAYRGPQASAHPGPIADWSNIDKNDPVSAKYLLTGYMSDADAVEEVASFAKRQAGKLFWVCDPVLGDNGRLYVDPSVRQACIRQAMPLATMVTPNHSELGWLTGRPVTTVQEAQEACVELHRMGPKYVVVTSMDASDGTLTLIASEHTSDRAFNQFSIDFAKQNVYLGGTGDLMAAMLLHGMDISHNDFTKACRIALSIVQVSFWGLMLRENLYRELQSVLRKTVQTEPNSWDLQVVSCAEEILKPSVEPDSFVVVPLTRRPAE